MWCVTGACALCLAVLCANHHPKSLSVCLACLSVRPGRRVADRWRSCFLSQCGPDVASRHAVVDGLRLSKSKVSLLPVPVLASLSQSQSDLSRPPKHPPSRVALTPAAALPIVFPDSPTHRAHDASRPALPSDHERRALDEMRKALRTPSFNNGSAAMGGGLGGSSSGRRIGVLASGHGGGGGSGSGGDGRPDGRSDGQLGSDWSSFNVDVFLGVVDYARERLRDVRSLLTAMRETQQVGGGACVCRVLFGGDPLPVLGVWRVGVAALGSSGAYVAAV